MGTALLMAAALACSPQQPPAEPAAAADPQAQIAEIKSLVAKYIQAVDAADPALAGQVWLHSPTVSFIHPMGHEVGWEAIQTNIFQKAMGEMFSSRKLTANEITANIYGDTAVAEFNWTFEATWRKDGSPYQSSGRETQVYRRTASDPWALVHVHYSGMPAAPPTQATAP
jgi:ketosteroid isomerase-like protein